VPVPELVLATPLWPARGGNGLAMRSGVWLEALAGLGAVHLWVVPLAVGGQEDRGLAAELARSVTVAPLLSDQRLLLAHRVADAEARERAIAALPLPALASYTTAEPVARLRAALGSAAPRALAAVRTYVAPMVMPLLRQTPTPQAVLDLDDDDQLARRRLAALLRASGDPAAASREEREAERFAALERSLLPAFDLLLAANEEHVRSLRDQHPGAEVALLPNAVAMPMATDRPRRRRTTSRESGELRLLMVGNLSYAPNVDGARWLCAEIVPRLRAAGCVVRVRLAGSAPDPRVRALAVAPHVEVLGDVTDLAASYAWADVAVVPLRAGGGTRIKTLEAFAYGVPVVATSIGAEGLGVEDRVHLRITNDPVAFAAACHELGQDPALAGRLRRAARAVATRHARPRVVEALRERVRALLHVAPVDASGPAR
jgi:glycosyltransferase involved in cell wall biosynthesis